MGVSLELHYGAGFIAFNLESWINYLRWKIKDIQNIKGIFCLDLSKLQAIYSLKLFGCIFGCYGSSHFYRFPISAYCDDVIVAMQRLQIFA